MRLYKIRTHFWGKDLDEEAILGYVVVARDGEIYGYINKKFRRNQWPELVGMTQEEIVAAKGDYESEFLGEFYDQKFGWEDLGEISSKDIANLKRLKIIL